MTSTILAYSLAGGVSCGIPDFRSRDGLYAMLNGEHHQLDDPQQMYVRTAALFCYSVDVITLHTCSLVIGSIFIIFVIIPLVRLYDMATSGTLLN